MHTTLTPLWLAAALLALAAPAATRAATAQDTPPGYDAACHCHRNVPYGSAVWWEPTTRKITRQVMDIHLPDGTPPAGGWPVAYYGHPNGSSHFIAHDPAPGSRWSMLVRPLLEAGYVVVSYEFRHPVVNYIEGRPAPRYDIQRAINTFATRYAPSLGADPSNSFITGNSRGGGLGLLTALTGKFTGDTRIRGVWVAQAQTSFDCEEAADTFILAEDRPAFLAQCRAVPGAGSALREVGGDAPPVMATYEGVFRKELVHADEVDLHYADFGWQLCLRYLAQGEQSRCRTQDQVPQARMWSGMVSFMNALQQPR